MHQSASFMLVRADKLPGTPKAFQDYVKQHFLERNIFGQECYVAVRASSVKMYGNGGRKHPPHGVAPSHNVDVSVYKDGLAEGQSLVQWIEKARKKKNLIFEFHAYWNDGCMGSMVEDY